MRALLSLCLAVICACGDAPRGDAPSAEQIEVAPDSVGALLSGVDELPAAFRPGIGFDPETTPAGSAVGELVLDSLTAYPALVDGEYAGTARFGGRIQLSGSTMLHPDADLRNTAVCFEADSASAARLPRWRGDERRAWFCFENRDAAARTLGPPSEGVGATVVIEDFTIHRGMSDEVNSARFVRGVSRGGGPAGG